MREKTRAKTTTTTKKHTLSWKNDPHLGENDLSEEIPHEKSWKSVLEPVDFKGFLGHTPTPTLQKKPDTNLVCIKSPTTALLIDLVRYIKILTELRWFLIIHVYIWFVCAQVPPGNCQTMESYKNLPWSNVRILMLSNVGYQLHKINTLNHGFSMLDLIMPHLCLSCKVHNP